MVFLYSDYIITPLGESIDANLRAIEQGRTKLQRHSTVHGESLVTPAMTSIIDETKYLIDGYTLFESLCIKAIEGAKGANDLSDDRCIFVLSSTKADIWIPMAVTAKHIASYFGNESEPIVVSNACTSGVSAQLTAYRLIESGLCDKVVVVGCDVQCEFIVSGFQSFHALSDEQCKPFDAKRDGLNAGEAAACMILGNSGHGWRLMGGSIHNDANHISGPSRTAEGSLRCLKDVTSMIDPDDLAFVSVHGTGTPYNDEMESIAIHRAGLENVPVTALKGNYGHTMGAAGVLETILGIHALEEGKILPTRGYETQGTPYPVSLSNEVRKTGKRSFIKLLSGFGGINSAVTWTLGNPDNNPEHLTPLENWNEIAETTISSPDDLTQIYRDTVGSYPKFFKMDLLSKLGFVGIEKLMAKVRETQPDFALDSERTVVIVANRSSSLKNDLDYQETIKDKDDYFPSPALFVYTLPNIVAGEVAIRHKLFGETSCYVLTDEQSMAPLVQSTLRMTNATHAVTAWLECSSAERYYAHLKLLTL